MRNLRKALTLTAATLGVLAISGLASADCNRRNNVDLTIGNFSIDLGAGNYHRDWDRTRREEFARPAPARDFRRDVVIVDRNHRSRH